MSFFGNIFRRIEIFSRRICVKILRIILFEKEKKINEEFIDFYRIYVCVNELCLFRILLENN